jgi:type II secretory pathway pseudopilin PulG
MEPQTPQLGPQPSSTPDSDVIKHSPETPQTSPQTSTPQPSPQTPSVDPQPSAPYDTPISGIVVGGEPTPTDGPQPAAGGQNVGLTPTTLSMPAGNKRKFPKWLPLSGAGAVFLAVLAGFYFGYYVNPSLIYSQALANSGKGYNKLVDYVDLQSQAKYKGSEGQGNFTYKSKSFNTDGSINFKGDDKNGEFAFDVGTGTGRVKADIRYIKGAASSPDVYIKAGGIKGLGTLMGTPNLDAVLNKYDNTWIVIDHTLFDNLNNALGTSTAQSAKGPSREDVVDELRAAGKVNQQYLFTTEKDRAVMTVVKKYGIEKTNGHKVYHYKVALVKANVKKYIVAQQIALNSSKLGAWIKKNKYQAEVKRVFDDMKKSADDIKPSDTFDLYADAGISRRVYKLHFSDPKNNPAKNFVDFGLDYKGGDEYPFFISGESQTGRSQTSASLIANLNSKTNSVHFSFNLNTTGPDAGKVTGDFKYKPTNTRIKIIKPEGAKPLNDLLNELGLGSALATYTQPGASRGIQTKANDSKRLSDLKSLQTQLEAYFSEKGNYPSFAQFNDSNWRKANLFSFDENSLIDPDSSKPSLSKIPAAKVYAYKVSDEDGASCEGNPTKCSKYTLTATLSDGKTTSTSNLE